MNNLRRHKRFSATAFLNMPVHLSPFTPYFGHPVEGKLVDLSAGGLSMVINEPIPQGTKLDLCITFPNKLKVNTLIEIKRVQMRGKSYVVGLEFLNLAHAVAEKIDFMSHDYIDCESRIQQGKTDVCRTECAFYSMCSKPERLETLVESDVYLALDFRVSQEATA